jgi:ABC-type branched-subunit amino acid transport system ATPase component
MKPKNGTIKFEDKDITGMPPIRLQAWACTGS